MNDMRMFRAWDDKQKVWYYENVFLSHDGILWFRKDNKELIKVDWKVCFYTGLSDMDGTLIYEGDLVMYGRYTAPAQVIFDNGMFSLDWPQARLCDVVGLWETEPDELQLIGNVYQYPNFLKSNYGKS